MEKWLEIVVLAAVEGLTEFLPVSSTGHLIVAAHWLGRSAESDKLFEVVIQLGAVSAVACEYRRRLQTMLSDWRGEASRKMATNLMLAFIPAAVCGLLFYGPIKKYLFSPTTVAAALMIGGAMIILAERKKTLPQWLQWIFAAACGGFFYWTMQNFAKWTAEAASIGGAMVGAAMLLYARLPPPGGRTPSATEMEMLTPRQALMIGCCQVLSLFPGVSRAGATIVGAMFLGAGRKAATEFSFMLALPVMLAATGYDLLRSRDLLTAELAGEMAAGFVASFIAALLMIRLLLRYVVRNTYAPFGWYRLLAGACVLAAFHWP